MSACSVAVQDIAFLDITAAATAKPATPTSSAATRKEIARMDLMKRDAVSSYNSEHFNTSSKAIPTEM